jgi:hypothetical protein
MTEEKHSRWHWLHVVRHRLFLPALTAFTAHHLLYGELRPLVEGFREPWPEVIAHPLVEFVLDLLISTAFFLGTLFVKKLAKFAFTWLVITGAAHYLLVRHTNVGKASLYLLWCGVVWAAAAITLRRLYRAAIDYYAEMDEDSNSLVPFVFVTDEKGVPMPSAEDEEHQLFGDAFSQFIWLSLLSILTSTMSTILLGVALWNGFGMTARSSILLSLSTGVVLAAVQWWLSRNPSPTDKEA